MRINEQNKSMDMEQRDINYILPAYIRSYLFHSKNEEPEKIVFPMFPSVPHPIKQGVMVPIEWVPPLDSVAVEIAKDGEEIAEVTPEQEAVIDEKDEEAKRLKEELAKVTPAPEDLVRQEQEAAASKEEAKTESPAKAAFSVGPDQPPPDRVPKDAPGGDIGPGAHPSDMGSRDARDQAQTAKDLAEGPEIDEAAEKPYEKTIKRDEQGHPVVEDMTDEHES